MPTRTLIIIIIITLMSARRSLAEDFDDFDYDAHRSIIDTPVDVTEFLHCLGDNPTCAAECKAVIRAYDNLPPHRGNMCCLANIKRCDMMCDPDIRPLIERWRARYALSTCVRFA
jgi:hypothetical protein